MVLYITLACTIAEWNLVEAAGRKAPMRPAAGPQLRDGAISKKETDSRRFALERFAAWLATVDVGPLESLARTNLVALCEWLVEYIYQLYEMRWARCEARWLLNAVGDTFLWTRGHLSGPWSILRNWERLEPDSHRTPMPWAWLRALTVAALSWGWHRLALGLSIAFFALLRPIELSGLRRLDVLLPREHLMGDFLLLRVREPKSAWARGSQQYARVDDPVVFRWLVAEMEKLGPEESIWPGSPATFARRLAHLCGATLGDKRLVLPSSLRTGGATHFFMKWNEDLPRLQWRGRWRDARLLAIYVQELSAGLCQMRLTPEYQVKVEALSALYETMISEF